MKRISANEAMTRLGIKSRTTLLKLISEGRLRRLPAERGRLFFDEVEINRYIESGGAPPAPEAGGTSEPARMGQAGSLAGQAGGGVSGTSQMGISMPPAIRAQNGATLADVAEERSSREIADRLVMSALLKASGGRM